MTNEQKNLVESEMATSYGGLVLMQALGWSLVDNVAQVRRIYQVKALFRY